MPETYESAGVNIGEATEALAGIRESARSTYTPAVLSDVGDFGGMFAAQFPGFREPVLVASIDGVGTKTLLATELRHFAGLGADIVYHSVNDILAQGARPLFFLDYFGTSRLKKEEMNEVVCGIAAACREVGCALIGGETAEMPDVYREGQFEIAGSIVGVVERSERLPRTGIEPGDALIGLASNGLHTNGFTLARKALLSECGDLSPGQSAGHSAAKQGIPFKDVAAANGDGERGPSSLRFPRDDQAPAFTPPTSSGAGDKSPVAESGTEVPQSEISIRDALLAPHRCYFQSVYPLLDRVHGIAHITGGGLVDNVPRMLPEGCAAEIDRSTWTEPPIFAELRKHVPPNAMDHTFNLGVGMVLAVKDPEGVIQALGEAGEKAWRIGQVVEGNRGVKFV